MRSLNDFEFGKLSALFVKFDVREEIEGFKEKGVVMSNGLRIF